MKTGNSSGDGATRATYSPVLRSPSSVHSASKTSVSELMPLESMPLWIVTFGSAPSGSAPVSQASSSGGTVAGSRAVRWSFRSDVGPMVTRATPVTWVSS